MRTRLSFRLGFGCLALSLLTPALGACKPKEGKHVPLPQRDDYQEAATLAKAGIRIPPFDEQVEKAVRGASRQGRRVVLVFGGDWDRWSHAFSTVVWGHPKVADLVSKKFTLLTVDSDSYPEILHKYRNPVPKKFPFLVLLDDKGQPASMHETHSMRLEDQVAFDNDAVLELFKQLAQRRVTPKAPKASAPSGAKDGPQ